jgi:hypothetical protein
MEAAKEMAARVILEANRLMARLIRMADGKVKEMNRWMKRRIERSRARCERTEVEKRDQIKGLGKTPISKPNPGQRTAADQHRSDG